MVALGAIEIVVRGEFEGKGRGCEFGRLIESCRKGDPTVIGEGDRDGIDLGHQVDEVVRIVGVLYPVPVEVLDFIEQVDHEGFFEGSVMFVGYADFDGVGSRILFVVKGNEGPQGSVPIQAEQVTAAKQREGKRRVGIRISG